MKVHPQSVLEVAVIIHMLTLMETATNTRNGQNCNDLNMTSQSMHFVKMYLRDYGVFRGVSEIEFNRNKTLIVGKAGAGKTTIRDVLKKGGLSKGVRINRAGLGKLDRCISGEIDL